MIDSTRERSEKARARIREQQEREERLPRALCAACGGVVAAGEGHCEDESPWAGPARAAWADADNHRASKGLPPIMGWRRRHDRCRTPDQIVRSVIGIAVSPEVAGEALGAMHPLEAAPFRSRRPILAKQRAADPYRAAAALPVPAKPWAHLDDNDRTNLASAVQRARGDVEPRRCREGACAWCGISHSIGWRASPERWRDGSPAPLCRACASVWDRRGHRNDRDGLRAAALEALSGATSWGSTGLDLRTFVDIAGDDHAGTEEPWTYAPAPIAAVRERARLMWPGSLPTEIRDEYLARSGAAQREALEKAAASDAESAAAAAQRELEAAKAAGWPV